ncbi:MAG: SdiA-regulated domain-containing protein [Bacteroidia bacterium]|nr:SdiA-regulated domain-containing protein [Bacteroidia bacterium]
MKMPVSHSTLLRRWLPLLLLLTVAAAKGQHAFKYNLQQPNIHRQLPPMLNEVSGLTDVDDSRVACVQDEQGIVFIYDFRTDDIISRHAFDSTGDFEGLTLAGNTLYILRSDGRLTEWQHFRSANPVVKHYTLLLQTANNEGLCYDAGHDRLLIAAKSKPAAPDARTLRLIYAFDLEKKQLSEEPLYRLNTDQLAADAKSFSLQLTDTTARGMVKPFNFRPASLSVHPLSDEIYMISAADKILLTMNRKGEVTYMTSLPPHLFTKAEGITFLPDGTMIITNEAAGKTPGLFVFEMLP